MTKKVLVFRHIDNDRLGRFEDLIAQDSLTADFVDMHLNQPLPPMDDYDLLMVMGGPMDVFQEREYPWLATEKQVIKNWVVDQKKPYLGICLGHQLLATALGGEVANSPPGNAEISLHQIEINDEGSQHALLRGLDRQQSVLQWHHCEVTRLPDDIRSLASSPACRHQIIAYDSHAFSVQFHFEWTLEFIRKWVNLPDWMAALDKEIGSGGHPGFVRDAESMMPELDAMTRKIYRNFTDVTGLLNDA